MYRKHKISILNKKFHSTFIQHIAINFYLYLLISLYLIFSVSTYSSWKTKGINNITGDEPHYLVMANGISKYHSLEQTKPYKEEFITREIYRPGLNPNKEIIEPSPNNTHAVMGPNGLFNVHNIGLPILLSIPFAIGSVSGAKVFMILNGAGIVYLLWKFITLYSKDNKINFLITLPLAISHPLIFASNQIYPELPAASLSLIGLYWICRKRSLVELTKKEDYMTFIAISFLPWLHIKYIISSIILTTTIGYILYREEKISARFKKLVFIFTISFTILLFYNNYAFGNITGPYKEWAVYGKNIELSFKSFTVFCGLLFDQEQGIFFQNPINYVGLLAIGFLYRKDRIIFSTIGLISLSSICINSLHPAWYGGASLIGRFGWTGGLTFMLYALFSLLLISRLNTNIFLLIISASISISLHIYKLFTIDGVNLYNQANNPNSSRLFNLIGAYLPSWLESENSLIHPPNLIFIIFSLCVLCCGFYFSKKNNLNLI